MAKRILDLLVAAAALIVLSPVMAVIGILVRITSPGPALFRQGRLGQGGKPFCVLKFRTMVDQAPDLRNRDGSAYTAGDDPRVTRFGRWLRRTSLDELPQLWNVVRGEMSLVGPRPDQTDQARFYSPEEMRKLEVKPGLTGLAQISGRNAIGWARRKQLDVEYVATRSFRVDLGILCRTIPYVLLRRDIESAAGAEGEQRGYPAH